MLGGGAELFGAQVNGVGFRNLGDHQVGHIHAQQGTSKAQFKNFATPKTHCCAASKAITNFGIESLQHDIHHSLNLGLGHVAVDGGTGL